MTAMISSFVLTLTVILSLDHVSGEMPEIVKNNVRLTYMLHECGKFFTTLRGVYNFVDPRPHRHPHSDP